MLLQVNLILRLKITPMQTLWNKAYESLCEAKCDIEEYIWEMLQDDIAASPNSETFDIPMFLEWYSDLQWDEHISEESFYGYTYGITTLEL